eukprot:1519775-Prymnesium_polylepis.1
MIEAAAVEVAGESDQFKPGKPHGREHRRRRSGGVVGGCNGGRGGGGAAESGRWCPSSLSADLNHIASSVSHGNDTGAKCVVCCARAGRANVCVCFSLTPRWEGRTSSVGAPPTPRSRGKTDGRRTGDSLEEHAS